MNYFPSGGAPSLDAGQSPTHIGTLHHRMNAPSANLLVSVGERTVMMKIAGRANFDSSVNFKTLVNELRQKNYDRYVIDLSECLLMDSTFLGVLAGFGLKLSSPAATQAGAAVELLNP